MTLAGMDMHRDLLSIASSRYSCRAFQEREVPLEKLNAIIDLARTAPSDCNTQSCRLFIIGGDRLKQILSAMHDFASTGVEEPMDVPVVPRYSGVHRERRRECARRLYEAVGVPWGDRAASERQSLENFRAFGAPHLAIVTVHEELGERGIFDAGIFVGHLLLAAQSLGVATIAQGAIARYPGTIRKHSPIPEELRIICGVSLGFADEAHSANSFRADRSARDDVVTYLS